MEREIMSITDTLSLDEELEQTLSSIWEIAPVGLDGYVWGERRQIAAPTSTSTVTWPITYDVTLVALYVYRDGEHIQTTKLDTIVNIRACDSLILTYTLNLG